ncbi:hypothetical protein HY970_03510 [Candidatus Kaiserbacteria bacterium]|nr:hypothetical protein [Candidatus Kaiserbacteria bacterium]
MDKIIGVIVLLLLIGGGVYYFKTHPSLRNSAPSTQQADSGTHSVSWQFAAAGTDESTSAPKNKVTVVIDGTSHDAGTYVGPCFEIGRVAGVNDIDLREDELAGAYCWFAGGGDEVGVFSENGKLVVKHGELGEPTAESAAFRGNFTTLFEVSK